MVDMFALIDEIEKKLNLEPRQEEQKAEIDVSDENIERLEQERKRCLEAYISASHGLMQARTWKATKNLL